MSTYIESETEMDNAAMLEEACKAAGIRCTLYPENDGIYRKWTRKDSENRTGYVRGQDAALVIHGGLDTTPRRYCGDTAFVWEDGKLRAMLDVTHGNSQSNWKSIQANYTALDMEKLAARHGIRTERIETSAGRIRLRVYAPSQDVMVRRSTVRRG